MEVEDMIVRRAAKLNDHATIKRTHLLNPQAADKEGRTALHLAAEKGNLEAVEALLAKGFDVNAGTRANRTPLHFACEGGHLETVRRLLNERHTNAHLRTADKESVLHLAATSGRSDLVRLLLLDVQGLAVNAVDIRQRTPLHFAAAFGHRDVVRQLLVQGKCNPNLQDDRGYTAVHHAAFNDAPDVVCELREAVRDISVNTEANDSLRRTPLHVAALNNHTEVVHELLNFSGVQVDRPDKRNQTALHLAASKDNVQIVRSLIAAGAEVMAEDQRKRTPFHEAASKGNRAVMAILALEMAKSGEQERLVDVVKCLARQKCSVEEEDEVARTFLHWTAARGLDEVVRRLVEGVPCDLTRKDAQGCTALRIAVEEGNGRCAKAILHALCGRSSTPSQRRETLIKELTGVNAYHTVGRIKPFLDHEEWLTILKDKDLRLLDGCDPEVLLMYLSEFLTQTERTFVEKETIPNHQINQLKLCLECRPELANALLQAIENSNIPELYEAFKEKLEPYEVINRIDNPPDFKIKDPTRFQRALKALENLLRPYLSWNRPEIIDKCLEHIDRDQIESSSQKNTTTLECLMRKNSGREFQKFMEVLRECGMSYLGWALLSAYCEE